MSQENTDAAVAHLAAARTSLAAGASRASLTVAQEATQAALDDINAALADPELDAEPVADAATEPVEPVAPQE